jgi:hypothetical protein
MKMSRVLIVFTIIGGLQITSCRVARQSVVSVPIHSTERIVERLVPVPMPADSASIMALLECNDQNQVILKELSEAKSKNVQSQFDLLDGKIKYSLKTIKDIIYVPVVDSTLFKEVPIRVEVPIEVNVLTGWQWSQIYAGRVLLSLMFLFGVYKVLKWKSIL